MGLKTNPSVIHRFTGKDGKKRLIEAFTQQILVAGNVQIAKELVLYAKLYDVKSNINLILQGGADDDIYFIISGTVSVRVNDRDIAKRSAGEHIGEMTVIDSTARRSATIRSLEPCVFAKVNENDFARLANKYPDLWRRTAVTLARRLKERNKFQTVPRSQPVIFIGSSSEGLKVAEAIYTNLSKSPCVPILWTKGIFEASKTTIEELMICTKESDFAVIVLTPDDITKSRMKSKPSPRDNVVFELGLFMGAISRERTYIVAPRSVGIKIPTDLLGITCLTFEDNSQKSSGRSLKPVLRHLRKLIEKYGPI
jgi:predicted nucleotide-binding protein